MEPGNPEVVLRYLDGRTVRGCLEPPFRPSASDRVVVITRDGERLAASLFELKAVFFLKAPGQRELELALGEKRAAGGARARVEFVDGEVMRGVVRRYSVEDRGFLLEPTDRESNNERVFVVAKAVRGVELEG